MTNEGFEILYPSLTASQQALLLAQASANLTVCSRDKDVCELGHELAVKRLLALNEVQQTLMAQLTPILSEDDQRYPDDVFVKILFERAFSGKVEKELLWALDLASARIQKDK